MHIAGFQPTTLSDYPGHVAAIVFTQGCNFRCPFCQNTELLEMTADEDGAKSDSFDHDDRRRAKRIPENFVLEQLTQRVGQLTGVVVTGGEPTVQKDLLPWLRQIKELGYNVKLDTNGSQPRILQKAIELGLVDFIAMDVKATPEKYPRLAGVHVDLLTIERSIAIIAQSGLPHEFRTTYVTPLLDERDLRKIKSRLPSGSLFRIQPFVRENAYDTHLRKPVTEQKNHVDQI